MQLDSYVVLEYIKSSVDIILNLKFEEIEKRLTGKNPDKMNIHDVIISRRQTYDSQENIFSQRSILS